jgi:hypothetical protein
MKPKTKPEPKTQLKFSVPQSLAEARDAAIKEAEDTPYDWTSTIIAGMEQDTAEFRTFVAEYKARSQAQVRPKVGPEISPKPGPINGSDPDRNEPGIVRTN